MNDYVRKYLDLSTGHITENDKNLLEEAAKMRSPGDPVILVVHAYDEGFFIPVSDCMDLEAIGRAGFSNAFASLITMCLQRGYSLLRLDCDAPICDALQKFEW